MDAFLASSTLSAAPDSSAQVPPQRPVAAAPKAPAPSVIVKPAQVATPSMASVPSLPSAASVPLSPFSVSPLPPSSSIGMAIPLQQAPKKKGSSGLKVSASVAAASSFSTASSSSAAPLNQPRSISTPRLGSSSPLNSRFGTKSSFIRNNTVACAASSKAVAGKKAMGKIEVPKGITLNPLPSMANGADTFIFWDIDNLNIPRRTPTRDFINSLMEIFQPSVIQAFGNTFFCGIENVLELNRCNVDVFCCPSGGDAKELADNRLVAKMNTLINDYAKINRPAGRIILISNDKDFIPHLYSARQQKWEVGIVCASYVLEDLKASAHHFTQWEDFLSHVGVVTEKDRSQSTNRSRPNSVSPVVEPRPESTPPLKSILKKEEQTPLLSPPNSEEGQVQASAAPPSVSSAASSPALVMACHTIPASTKPNLAFRDDIVAPASSASVSSSSASLLPASSTSKSVFHLTQFAAHHMLLQLFGERYNPEQDWKHPCRSEFLPLAPIPGANAGDLGFQFMVKDELQLFGGSPGDRLCVNVRGFPGAFDQGFSIFPKERLTAGVRGISFIYLVFEQVMSPAKIKTVGYYRLVAGDKSTAIYRSALSPLSVHLDGATIHGISFAAPAKAPEKVAASASEAAPSVSEPPATYPFAFSVQEISSVLNGGAARPSAAPAFPYEKELEEIRSMGFMDDNKSREVLSNYNGDLNLTAYALSS